MVAEYGIKLAVDIITTDFGNVVAKVCECLLRRGTLTRIGISRFTELAAANVSKSLLVLIQHNCVQAFILGEEGDFGESSSASTQYTALFDNIIHRMRFPKFLSIVSKELDPKCASLLEGLLQHGRLSLTQILDRAKGYANEGGDTADIAFREKFDQLVECLFVEHCPAPEPLVSLPTEEEMIARKKAAKSAKKDLTLEERAVNAAKPMEAERFSTDKTTIAGQGNGSKSALKKKVGKKRKHSLLEVEDEHGIMDGDREPLWRVNFDEFKRRFRNKACVDVVKAEYDDVAGMVLSAMLETTKMIESTVSLSLDAIYQEVIKNERGIQLNLEHVRASLEQFGSDSNEDEDIYNVDLNDIIRKAQSEELESIVLKRYGKDAFRMFRLLAKEGKHETSKISAKILLEQKDAKNLLFKLWKDNYVHMEVAVHAPQAEILTWSVSETIQSQILDELYHAALNLRIRASLEMDRGREVMTLDKDKRVGEASSKYKKLKQVKLLLDSSLSKLDDAIMLFHDFT